MTLHPSYLLVVKEWKGPHDKGIPFESLSQIQ